MGSGSLQAPLTDRPARARQAIRVTSGPLRVLGCEVMSSDQGRPIVIRNTNSCCQGSGCGFVILVVLVVVAWDALPRWAAVLLAIGLGVPLAALAIAAAYYKLNPSAPPLIGPNGWRARRAVKPTSELSAEFRIANYNGGLAVHLTPEERGTLTLPPANRWELRFAGTSDNVFGKMTRFVFQATATGPTSCRVTMQDIQDPTVQAEFDLPQTAASVAQRALSGRRFSLTDYDGGLPLDRKRHRDGTFVLTADNRWQLHFAATARWLHGPCAGYRFEVADTGPSSCRVTMHAAQAPGAVAGFELAQDSAAEVREAISARSPIPALPVDRAVPVGNDQASGEDPVHSAPPAAPAPTPSDQARDIIADVKRLAELRDAGILSEEEFQAKKTELLSRL